MRRYNDAGFEKFSDYVYGNIDKSRKETVLDKWKELIEGMIGK